MNKLLYTIAIGAALFSTACTPSEDDIIPSGNYSVIHMDFPQGNNSYDQDLVKIHDDYGTYVLYKDIWTADLNRKWIHQSTDNKYFGEDVPEEYREFYVKFLTQEVFGNLTPQLKTILGELMPLKIFFVHNFHGEVAGTGTDPTPVEKPLGNKMDGFDFWAFSFSPETVDGTDDTNMRMNRSTILFAVLKEAYARGLFSEPEGLRDGINFSTALKYKDTDATNVNYLLTRGFPWYMYDTFGGSTELENYGSHSASYYNLTNSDKSYYRDYFLEFVKVSLYYSPEQLAEKYPAEKYPLLARNIELTVNAIKSQIGIDLSEIAK